MDYNYGVTICWDDEDINLTKLKKGPGLFIATDISRLQLNRCKRLAINIPQSQLRFLKPQMPLLEELDLSMNGLKYIELYESCYPSLERLILDGNEIESAAAIFKVKGIPSLKMISLIGNPIATNKTELELLKQALPNINIRTA
jgi:Leucine-rich repeat (LRR) protein